MLSLTTGHRLFLSTKFTFYGSWATIMAENNTWTEVSSWLIIWPIFAAEITISPTSDFPILSRWNGTSIPKWHTFNLKEHRPILYNDLVLSEKLFPYLKEIGETAARRIEQLQADLLKANPSPDKATQQMAWVQHMNMLKAQAEEIVLNELIYCWYNFVPTWDKVKWNFCPTWSEVHFPPTCREFCPTP